MTTIATARPMPTRYEDMTPADRDALYLRLAQAVKRFEVRQALRDGTVEPLTITQPAPVTPPSGRGRRGPYRRRAVGVTAAGRA